MKPSTRLDLCILISSLMVILCVVLWVTTEKQEPWTKEQQCQYYRIWAQWPEHGECK